MTNDLREKSLDDWQVWVEADRPCHKCKKYNTELEELRAEVELWRSDMPAHGDFSSDCCGLFIVKKEGGLHCNECGEFIVDAIYPYCAKLEVKVERLKENQRVKSYSNIACDNLGVR